MQHIFVGSEDDFIAKRVCSYGTGQLFTVLFYGQFIPLHGTETIVRAAWLVQEQMERAAHQIQWVLVGMGQESERVDRLVESLEIRNLRRVLWMDTDELIDAIRGADVCLGVFGESGKVGRVIPNKVFQVLAARRPLITADTPAIREIVCEPTESVSLIPQGDAAALAEAVLEMYSRRGSATLHESLRLQDAVTTAEVSKQLLSVLGRRKST